MSSLAEIVVSCGSPQRIMGTMNSLCPQIKLAASRDAARHFRAIKWHYYQLYGEQGLYERVNKKSVETIFNEYNKQCPPRVIEQSEINGVSFTLFAAPDEDIPQ